ncbi:hypothetical protein DK28_0210490 [Peptococcaceae bacterium SCADC1_2_3]|jgi:predicted transposase YdaD|nr:hypothetical protein DK28_0210455 [Peptococcaceae bacterium SCADC1_2_3]KFD41290.1 hypothetical protein DK28_0210490 [Peptococcaceae bacterium SCADC1_2_3]KFI35997.1 hypothetical protein HY00_09265 [Peptococcaceae bacterium SCADC1_2_3]
MPKIDLPVKRLIQRCSYDWVKFLQPDCRQEWVKPFKSEYTPKIQSKLDDVFMVEDPGGAYLVNFEPMGYYDAALPARMMRYRSDLWEATLQDKKGTPSILQEEEPRQILQETFEVINKVKDEALRQDLLVVMGILAGGKYAAELVYSLIRREMVMESPIYQEWVKEERIEAEARGEARGRIEKAWEDICKFMVKRFGVDSGETMQKIKQIPALEILDNLMEDLFATNTQEEARAIIDRYIAIILQ